MGFTLCSTCAVTVRARVAIGILQSTRDLAALYRKSFAPFPLMKEVVVAGEVVRSRDAIKINESQDVDSDGMVVA